MATLFPLMMRIPLTTRIKYPSMSNVVRHFFPGLPTAKSNVIASNTLEITVASDDTFITTKLKNRVVDPDRDDATHLVDRLLERTRHLMTTTATTAAKENNNTTTNLEHLYETTNVDQMYHHTIAYSGGIDSSLVAAIIYQISADLNCSPTTTATNDGNNKHHRHKHTVSAVLGISPAVSMEQVQQAEEVAAHIGISLIKIPTNEGSDETYIANNGQACFACKSELYTKLIHHTIADYSQHQRPTDSSTNDAFDTSVLQPNSIQNRHFYRKLYNGTNADDCLDPTRVGLIAASQHNVLSPLNTCTKEEVRKIAKHLHLPNWNVASNPCLRSRLAIGISATKEHLQRIESAERYIRQQVQNFVTVETNIRVRLLPQQQGCLEIDAASVDDATNVYHTNQIEWDRVLLQDLRFQSFTIRPFRSGSVAFQKSLPVTSSLLSSSS